MKHLLSFTFAMIFMAYAVSLWASNTPKSPQPFEVIQEYINKHGKNITAYDIEAAFAPERVAGDDKIQAITHGTPAQVTGTPHRGTNFTTAITALSATKFVVAYIAQSPSGHKGEVVTAEINSGTLAITQGTIADFASLSSDAIFYVGIAAVGSSQFVVTYQRSGVLRARVGTVSGTSITINSSPIVFQSAASFPQIDAINSTQVMISFRANTGQGRVQIATVSGTGTTATISFGNVSDFAASIDAYYGVTILSSTKFVAAYHNGTAYEAVVGEFSGNSITGYGTAVTMSSGAAGFLDVAAVGSDHIIAMSGTFVIAGEISGTSISFGTAVGIGSYYFTSNQDIVGLNNTQALLSFSYQSGATDGTVRIATISGTTVSLGTLSNYSTTTARATLTVEYLGNGLFVTAGANLNNYYPYIHPGDASAEVLPVELTTFEGAATAAGTRLTWQTATEKNNEGFDIQRSTDGKAWETIGFVQGQGTTQEAQNYTYTDEAPLTGTSYYRLKQVDFDGAFEYSEVINITIEQYSNKTIAIFPNPVSDELNIENGQGQATIYNAIGQPVRTFDINETTTTINVEDLPKGQYLLSIQKANGEVITQQFVK